MTGLRMRIAGGAAILAATALMSIDGVEAQSLDVLDDPSICSRAVSADCLESVGAGAAAIPQDAQASTRACAEQLAIYSACLSYATGAGAPTGGGSRPQASVGGSLPISVEGLLNPKQREVYPFSHGGGCVSVSITDTTTTADVSLRTAAGAEVAKRGSRIDGKERLFTQFLPAGHYQLGVEARRKATPYRASVTAIGDC